VMVEGREEAVTRECAERIAKAVREATPAA
jgi:hypothetical protein